MGLVIYGWFGSGSITGDTIGPSNLVRIGYDMLEITHRLDIRLIYNI